MVQTNDQVIGTLALSLGQAGQVPGVILSPIASPVFEADRYREEYLVFKASVSPSGGAGVIVFTIETPKNEAWMVRFASLNNPPGGTVYDAEGTVINVRDTSLNWKPVRREINPGETRSVVGNGNHAIGVAVTEDIPESVFVPSESQFTMTLTAQSPPFPAAAVISTDIVVLKIPKERLIAVGELKTASAP